MTEPAIPPGDRRPKLDRPQLDRPPSERYAARTPVAPPAGRLEALTAPLAIVLGTGIIFVVLGGILAVTAGLVIVALVAGWLTGRLISPPGVAAAVALAAVMAGLLAIWLFGRVEGGVLDPISYLAEVEGPIVVVLCLLGAGGLAAAASR